MSIIYKCKMCGGDLDVTENSRIASCPYCGAKQTISNTNDEIVANLFNRANNLRLRCEFDKAQDIYEKIVAREPNDSEAYWGIVLCKYGVEYVEDPTTLDRMPTCHRTQVESILTDVDYLAAIENADTIQTVLYENEAKEIDKLQRNILAIANNEKPFDVFICYKETDENGKRTVDSVIANDIYYQLVKEGFKVFYSAITLEDKLGQEYEPYIYAALNSAKVMLVVGTKPEYFNSVWVKNEWSRYLKIIKKDRNKLLIPCYKDMDAYDLPEEFSHLQAQDMGKIGFINDVIRGINKILISYEPKSTINQEMFLRHDTEIAPLLERMYMFLEDGEWDRADDFAERILDIEPKFAYAYLGKLMAKYKIHTKESIIDCKENFELDNNYKRIMCFGDDKIKNILTKCINTIKTNSDYTYKESTYSEAIELTNSTDIDDLEKAIKLLQSISNFKDANDIIEKCQLKIDSLKKEDKKKRLKVTVDDLITQKEKLIEDLRFASHSEVPIIRSQLCMIDEQIKDCEENGFIFLEANELDGEEYVDFECPYCQGDLSYTKMYLENNKTITCPYCERKLNY